MTMAGKGLAGQRFSHAPHPIHLPESIAGTPSTRDIAFTGQCRSQAVHRTLSFAAMQRSLCQMARPICVRSRVSSESATIAPAGHAAAQRVHAGRQYPYSKPISGTGKRPSPADGRNTFSGHAVTQSWHPMHLARNTLSPPAPAGTIGVDRSGTPGLLTDARPGSAHAPIAAIATPPPRNPLLVIASTPPT